jgi:hypothetical protein
MLVKNAWGFNPVPRMPSWRQPCLNVKQSQYLGAACNHVSLKRIGRQLLTRGNIWNVGDGISSTTIRQHIEGQI